MKLKLDQKICKQSKFSWGVTSGINYVIFKDKEHILGITFFSQCTIADQLWVTCLPKGWCPAAVPYSLSHDYTHRLAFIFIFSFSPFTTLLYSLFLFSSSIILSFSTSFTIESFFHIHTLSLALSLFLYLSLFTLSFSISFSSFFHTHTHTYCLSFPLYTLFFTSTLSFSLSLSFFIVSVYFTITFFLHTHTQSLSLSQTHKLFRFPFSRGQFHQPLCAKQKVASAQRSEKNLQFNFTNNWLSKF